MTMLRDRSTLLGLLAAALLSLAALPFLLRAEQPELDLRRRTIASMTHAEREHLERNFDQFQSMGDAERQRMRQFEAALAADQASNRGRLSETLRIYGQWLQTITPHQRDALRKEPDPVKRIAMMRDMVENQRDERVTFRMGNRSEVLGPIPRILRSDLEAMLEILDQKSSIYLSTNAELDEYEGIRRSLKMFELLARENRSVRELMTETNYQQLLAAISDEATREELQTLPESERPLPEAQMLRFKLGMALFMAVETELDRELRQRRISPENKKGYFQKLPAEEQDQLLSLTPEQFHQQLHSRYVETEWSSNRINMGMVRQFFNPQRPGGQRPAGRDQFRPPR